MKKKQELIEIETHLHYNPSIPFEASKILFPISL
jgi:hypothetical protein